jgi:lactobin A/cerein 7B family class IIb bacteriocin
MREINVFEQDQVDGGVINIVITLALASIAAGAALGLAAAERDNRATT